MRIRDERPEDIAAVRELNLKAFGQPDEADIVDKLRSDCPKLLSLVAEDQGRIVGHILFSPVTLERPEDTVEGMGLAPMAVLPELQRKGIGSKLVEEGLKRGRSAGWPFVVVLGHPEYYPRFGFEPARPKGIRCQWEVPDNVFLVLTFVAGLTGLARYRPEFG
jgi:putative acetyltransferase